MRDSKGMPKLLLLDWPWLIRVLSPNMEERGVALSLSREPEAKLKAELLFRAGKPNKDDKGAAWSALITGQPMAADSGAELKAAPGSGRWWVSMGSQLSRISVAISP